MAIVIKPKKSETASSIPTTNDLAVGEICINVVDQKIYTRKSDDSIVIVGSVTSNCNFKGCNYGNRIRIKLWQLHQKHY